MSWFTKKNAKQQEEEERRQQIELQKQQEDAHRQGCFYLLYVKLKDHPLTQQLIDYVCKTTSYNVYRKKLEFTGTTLWYDSSQISGHRHQDCLSYSLYGYSELTTEYYYGLKEEAMAALVGEGVKRYFGDQVRVSRSGAVITLEFPSRALPSV